jgi:Pyridoxamine 5'-phosphate oxidase
MEPKAELLPLPPAYGRPRTTLKWESVRARLEEGLHYWVATTRPDGRPHVVPLDGVWVDDAWYGGGAHVTVRHRNLVQNPLAVVHLPDALQAVIVEGPCELVGSVSPELVRRLFDASQKYAAFGYAPQKIEDYDPSGMWVLRPRRVLAWASYPTDATRFTFG